MNHSCRSSSCDHIHKISFCGHCQFHCPPTSDPIVWSDSSDSLFIICINWQILFNFTWGLTLSGALHRKYQRFPLVIIVSEGLIMQKIQAKSLREAVVLVKELYQWPNHTREGIENLLEEAEIQFRYNVFSPWSVWRWLNMMNMVRYTRTDLLIPELLCLLQLSQSVKEYCHMYCTDNVLYRKSWTWEAWHFQGFTKQKQKLYIVFMEK